MHSKGSSKRLSYSQIHLARDATQVQGKATATLESFRPPDRSLGKGVKPQGKNRSGASDVGFSEPSASSEKYVSLKHATQKGSAPVSEAAMSHAKSPPPKPEPSETDLVEFLEGL